MERRYETVIGMEVHVELQTASKMFCPCPAEHFQEPPNTHICPVCTSQPGALPVINQRAVELAAMTGLALGAQVQSRSVFARKNYVYPDLPKGYQISQYERPLCTEGQVEVTTEAGPKRVGVVRVHLEEDTGKLVHEGGASLVDYNRAGVPLMEIVSDSSIRSAAEAYAYLLEIRKVVRYLGASTGDMEKGAMRCEANISVRLVGAQEYGTKVEVKNLNSFRSVRNAIAHEVERQIRVLEEGGKVRQVTMGWEEEAGVTREQRSKECAEDYRYFPEPDLLEVVLSDAQVAALREGLPELPAAKAARFAARFAENGVTAQEISVTVEDEGVSAYFEQVAAHADPKQAIKWITGEMFRRSKEDNLPIGKSKVSPNDLADLINLTGSVINQTAAKRVLGVMWERGGPPAPIVDELGLRQISDTSSLEQAVADAIATNPEAVEKVRSGKDAAIKFLVGQVMKTSRGKANPQRVEELLRRQLGR